METVAYAEKLLEMRELPMLNLPGLLDEKVCINGLLTGFENETLLQ
ncbi:MAG: hypothetical protein JXR03_04320 [Cyclobacteriaceae bacterium]